MHAQYLPCRLATVSSRGTDTARRTIRISETHLLISRGLNRPNSKPHPGSHRFALQGEYEGELEDDQDIAYASEDEIQPEDFENLRISVGQEPGQFDISSFSNPGDQPENISRKGVLSRNFCEMAESNNVASAAAFLLEAESLTTKERTPVGLKFEHDHNASPDYSSATRFFGKKVLPLRFEDGPLNVWDLRASMEKNQRVAREIGVWKLDKEQHIRSQRFIASDWRGDVRVRDTGDPSRPQYREWTLREIWDLITLDGKNADPRHVSCRIEPPRFRTDFVAEGFSQQPEIPDWLASLGRIINEEDEKELLEPEAEGALLASEFSDFEDFGATTDAEIGVGMDDATFP